MKASKNRHNGRGRASSASAAEFSDDAAAAAADFFRDEHLFKLMVESAREYAIFAVDAGGRVVNWNAGAERIFGHRENEIVGRDFALLFTDDDRAAQVPRDEMEKALADGAAEGDRWLLKKDGTRFWASGRLMPLADDDGRARGFVKIVRDQTDRKLAEQDINSFETRFREMIRQSPLSTFVLDAGGRVKYVNPAFTKMWGVTIEEMAGYNALEDEQADALGTTAATRRVFAGEVIEIPPIYYDPKKTSSVGEGNACWIKTFAYPIKDESGRVLEVVAMHENVSEKLAAEEDRRHARERFEALVRATSQMVWTTDATGAVIEDSPSWRNFTGQSYDEWQGYGWLDALHPEDRPRAGAVWNAAVENQTHYEVEYRVRNRHGEYRWTLARGVPIRRADGSIREWVGMNTDITEQKRAEEALRASEEFNRSVIASSPDCFKILDVEGRLEYMNENGICLLELDDFAAVRHKLWQSFWSGAEHEAAVETVEKARGGEVARFQGFCPTAKGAPKWWDVIVAPVLGARGEIVRLVSVSRDITASKRAETEREQMLSREQQLRETAEKASRLKDEFLAMLSHELRTPLNAILGWSQMMRSGMIKTDQYERAIETIDRSARSQAQLIDDLLDITRIVTGKLRLNVEEVNFASIINAALQTVRPAAQAKNIRLSVSAPFEGTELTGDAERLQQVVWNLLSNAVKFTPRGGEIIVTLEAKGSHVKLTVEDRGEGIEPDFLPFVFDRFSQADMSSTRRKGGLGLGLSIVRHLVEMHGGRVRAASDGPGRGAAFTVELPVHIARADDEPERSRPPRRADQPPGPPTARLDGVRVLIVDDEPDACELLQVLLEQCGARVATASSAAEAYEMIASQPPDVLVSDIAMPDEDGYQLIEKVRRLSKSKGGALPAVALTAYASQTDRRRALEAGFQSHVTKPIDQNALVTILASLV